MKPAKQRRGRTKMTRLLIVRHGETEDNIAGKLVGRSQTPLTKKGIEQAQMLGRRLKNEKIDAIYCSTLKRSIQTAEEIAKFHPELKIIQTAALDERAFGELDGLTDEQMLAKYPEYRDIKVAHHPETAPKGGESKNQMVARIAPLIAEVTKKYSDQTVLFVAHGGINVVIISWLLKQPLGESYKLKQNNVCINEIEISADGRADLKKINDTAHLEPLRDTLDNEI